MNQGCQERVFWYCKLVFKQQVLKLFVGIFIVFITFSCLKEKAQNDHLIDTYYPLKKGYSWKYLEREYSSGALFTRKISHRIIGERSVDDKLIFTTNPDGLFAIYDENGVAKSGALVVRDNYGVGITVRTENNLPVYPSRLYYLLKIPLTKGNSWRNHASIFDISGQKFEIVDTDAVVELENGLRFENCIEVLSNYTSEGRRYTGKQWFAPDTGLVKSSQWLNKKGKVVLVYELHLIELPKFLNYSPETK